MSPDVSLCSQDSLWGVAMMGLELSIRFFRILWGTAAVSPARSLCQQDCSETVARRDLESSIRPFQNLLVHRWECLLLRLWTLKIAGRWWL